MHACYACALCALRSAVELLPARSCGLRLAATPAYIVLCSAPEAEVVRRPRGDYGDGSNVPCCSSCLRVWFQRDTVLSMPKRCAHTSGEPPLLRMCMCTCMWPALNTDTCPKATQAHICMLLGFTGLTLLQGMPSPSSCTSPPVHESAAVRGQGMLSVACYAPCNAAIPDPTTAHFYLIKCYSGILPALRLLAPLTLHPLEQTPYITPSACTTLCQPAALALQLTVLQASESSDINSTTSRG
jgi:hypothetical protein